MNSHAAISNQASAKVLVQSALKSELAGDNQQRHAELRQALAQSPDVPSAHWQSGQVRVGKSWETPTEVNQSAKRDRRLAEYRSKRDAAGNSAADQAALARWCRAKGLVEQQRAHWWQVLQLQPNNLEAIQALGLQPQQGMLATREQVQKIRLVKQATERWRPWVAKWRRAAERRDPPPTTLKQRIANISDSEEMLGLERAIWQQVGADRNKRLYREMLLSLMQMLRDNPYPAAAESQVRHAVLCDSADVRTAAIEGLKRHPLDHYVPLLLSVLQSPIEANTQYAVDAMGHLIARRSIYREGALADFSVSLTLSPQASRPAVILTNAPALVGLVAAAQQLNLADSQVQAARDAAAMRDQVAQVNRAIEARNAHVLAALTGTTNLDLGSEPTKWWTWWWRDYNESYSLDTKPRYDYQAQQSYVAVDSGDQLLASATYMTPLECFASSTKVWTLTGLQPIEQVKVGDLVLAQAVESGELAYKAVLAVTVRKPGPRMQLRLGGETVVTTPGHPFWVAGQGWRVCKQLEVGKRLHSLSGAVRIEGVEKLETDPTYAGYAYNLILDGFHGYFVGARGILVHDNTPRKPTAALLPGLPPD